MAKVIIEVKGLQNNDLTGKMASSKTGRDENHLYVTIGHLSDDYVILSNGSAKTVQMPKKRNLEYVNVLEDVDDEIKTSTTSKNRGIDPKIRRFLEFKGIAKEDWLPHVRR